MVCYAKQNTNKYTKLESCIHFKYYLDKVGIGTHSNILVYITNRDILWVSDNKAVGIKAARQKRNHAIITRKYKENKGKEVVKLKYKTKQEIHR